MLKKWQKRVEGSFAESSLSVNKKTFYITTPIYYVNDVPHIGHTSTTIFADIIARYHKELGKEVFFLTGTDEHGAKIAQAAEKAGLSPKEFCDSIAPRFEKIWKRLNISNEFFIRTTNPKHKKVVQELINKIYQKGDIYKSVYQGLYCIGCEKFLTESDLENGHCPLHPPEQTVEQKEENWFFKLSKYIPQLIKLIEDDDTNYIFPEGKRQEVLSKLKAGVHDISFSRANVKWGIPILWDKTQTIYVWVDALINYYSATVFLPGKEKFWPANIHLLAKEILWFHTVIWQAMLMAAGLPLPHKTFTHSFYIMDDKKMSKSLGNLIKPEEMIKLFGIDASRYLVASSLPLENDTNVSIDRFKQKYNADLANGLGNLVSRTAKLSQKNNFKLKGEFKPKFIKKAAEALNALNPPKALEVIWNESESGVSATNKLFNDKKIWELKGEKLENALEKVVANLLTIAYNLKPFMPKTSKKIEATFLKGEKLAKPLFPRI
ncbi:MAG: methionine--tRNA ligase [Patescibacteria group bacterium]|nr:methionine--tRNA ligase [Patescibacteria group bacterium]